LIAEFLEAISLILTGFMMIYLVRHYLFTLTVLRNSTKHKPTVARRASKYQPNVSILIPACDEELVIGRILKRMSELTYPANRLQVIVIDDASRDDTGKIARQYSDRCAYIKVLHRSQEEGRTGKSSVLNLGQKYTTGEIILCFDADY